MKHRALRRNRAYGKRRRWLYALRWYLPLALLPPLLVCAVVVWTLTTPMGTRFLLHAGSRLAGVQVQAVSGTLWRGVQVGQLDWVVAAGASGASDAVPDLSLHAEGLTVRLDWQGWLAGLRRAWRSSDARGAALQTALLQWQVPELRVRRVRLQGVALDGPIEQGRELTAQVFTALGWTAPALSGQDLTLLDIHAALALDAKSGVLTLHQARWQDVAVHMKASANWQDGTARMALAASGPDLAADLALSANWQARAAHMTLAASTTNVMVNLATDLALSANWQAMTARMTLAASTPHIATELTLSAHWPDQGHTAQLSLHARTTPPTRWQGQAVQASVAADMHLPMQHIMQTVQNTRADVKENTNPPSAPWWQAVRVDNLALDVQLGQTDAAARSSPASTPPQTLRVHGRLGMDATDLDIAANMVDLAAWWPDWRGSVQGKGQLASSDGQRWQIRLHALSLNVDAVQAALQTPLTAQVELDERWMENLIEHPLAPPPVQWRVGAFAARLTLPDVRERDDVPDSLVLTLHHHASNGHLDAHGQAVWHAQGEAETPFSLLPVDLATVLPARRSQFDLNARWVPHTGLVSPQLRLDATVKHAGLGQVEASATYRLDGQDGTDGTDGTGTQKKPPPAPLQWQARIDIPDLHWLDQLAGETVEVGGRLQAQLQGSGGGLDTAGWTLSGTVSGEQIRLLRLEDGVRLLDGSLRARLDNKRLILERLRFAAVPRVRPTYARLAAWLQDPQAQAGWLDLSGSWLLDDAGQNGQQDRSNNDSNNGIDITLHRYPVLQRVDRYAMVSGTLHLALPAQAAAPALAAFSLAASTNAPTKQTRPRTLTLTGKVQVDAGWLDLEALTRVPTLDSDVVILRRDEEVLAPDRQTAGVDFSVALQLALGPRFYLTGYGMDTALVGELALALPAGAARLTAQGVLHPRGGKVGAYGQTLQLLEDSRITFAGDVTHPLLHIEAIRTGQTIQAGVRVSGTPGRPRVTLISYPEVKDTEKLSWLLFGRGPDESGGDAALLLSVGSSFLTDGGEPFYRRFGVDELGMRSGSLGSVGSVLPVESVVQGFASGTSEIERKFVVASTHLTERVSASVEQALSDTGTVGRLAWRLGRGVSAQLAVGTVQGLALIYHLVLDD